MSNVKTHLTVRGDERTNEGCMMRYPDKNQCCKSPAMPVHCCTKYQLAVLLLHMSQTQLTNSWHYSLDCEVSILTGYDRQGWSFISLSTGMGRQLNRRKSCPSWKPNWGSAACSKWYSFSGISLSQMFLSHSQTRSTLGFRMLSLMKLLGLQICSQSSIEQKTPYPIWTMTNCIYCEHTNVFWKTWLRVPVRSSRENCGLNFLKELFGKRRRSKWQDASMMHYSLGKQRPGTADCTKRALTHIGCLCRSQPGQSVQHTDALGCLLVIKMILSVLDRHRHARSMWHTWRVIPGKYRRRFGPLGYSSRLPLNPRYRNNDLHESTQYVATHIAQHKVGLSMIAWPLVDKSRLHVCLTCLEVQLLSPCLRTGGPIRRVQCAHVVILLELYSNATDWVEAWFCWGHSVCFCSKNLLSLSCHVRPVTAPKPAQEVPFSLRCHCIAAKQHLCPPRSGQSSATVHKASEGHGNNKQPRFNMELDFTLGSQNYTSTVESMTARSHLSCVGGSCEPSGRSISGMEHASILEAVDAGCTSQIPGIISVPNRSADSQGYVCRARLPQHPGCQLQPQSNGLTACQMSGSHILGIGLACSSAHLAVFQDAAKPTTINSKPKDEMDSVLDTCLSANRMFHPQHLDAALLHDTTQAATYVERGKFNLLLAVNVPLGCPYAGRCLAVSLHSQWFQVIVAWGGNESTVNSTQQKQVQVCSADDHMFASLISVERQLVLNEVPWITHAHTAIQHSVIRTLVLTCFGAIAVVRIICGLVRAVYAMLRVPDFSTTNHHEMIARTQRPCTNYVLSRPGPKSGGGIPCRSAHALLITAYFCIKGATGVKVAPPAVGGAEGGQAQQCRPVAPPKPYGHLSPQTVLLQDQVRKATKRSFKRACRRALQYGQAKYKGSTITMKMIQPSWLDCAKVTSKPHRSTGERKGLRVFCWNSGGLASGQWDELLLHIDPQAWDILLIQETHWRCFKYR